MWICVKSDNVPFAEETTLEDLQVLKQNTETILFKPRIK